MTTKEFFSKHYGSLSVGAFSLGLLAMLAAFGDDIGALTERNIQKPEASAPAPPPPVQANTTQPSETPAASDVASEPELDPLEKALAEEAEREAARNRATGDQNANPTSEASPPQAPADDETGSANGI